jgi:hypothetical protein
MALGRISSCKKISNTRNESRKSVHSGNRLTQALYGKIDVINKDEEAEETGSHIICDYDYYFTFIF